MAESKYTQELYEEFKKNFPSGWIDSMGWDTKTGRIKTAKAGIALIWNFEGRMFSLLARLILSGDHLINETVKLKELLNLTYEDVVTDQTNTSKRKLQLKYQDLLNDIHDSIYLVRYHDTLTRKRYEQIEKNEFIRAIPYDIQRENRNELVQLLETICDVCWAEYEFSYDEGYIRNLLMLREKLKSQKKGKTPGQIRFIDASMEKLEVLLCKLSIFATDKTIIYDYDFNVNTISLTNSSQFKEDDFRAYFLDYMDVERISSDKIREWEKNLDPQKESVKLWNFVFLMRYYVKKNKARKKIDDLVRLNDRHYKESEETSENIVNKLAGRSGRNYMYNSRFSYKCQSYKGYTFKEMKRDLSEIENIQEETYIRNYHPYQKAIEYIINNIRDGLASLKDNRDSLNEQLVFLEECFEKFKDCIDWCKKNQPYFLQLRYNFSTIHKKGESEEDTIDVFYPSSFCRPLRFAHLEKQILDFSHDIAFLKFEVMHHVEKIEFVEAKKKINTFEKKNLEYIGLTTSAMAFLVGLLSIFIGNDGSVSIFTKMEYVTALGLILLLFVCVGYFMISDIKEKLKPFIFGFLAATALAYIGYFFIDFHKMKYSSPPKAKVEIVANKNDSTATTSAKLDSEATQNNTKP